MGPWHGEISSNVTFLYCTKRCIDVAVLCGRPLTHVSNLSMHNLNPFFALFLSFFLHENLQKGCVRVRKWCWFKVRHTKSTMGASVARKLTRLGPRVLRHQLAQVCASSCLMTCFSCAARVHKNFLMNSWCAAIDFRYSKRARTFFT